MAFQDLLTSNREYAEENEESFKRGLGSNYNLYKDAIYDIGPSYLDLTADIRDAIKCGKSKSRDSCNDLKDICIWNEDDSCVLSPTGINKLKNNIESRRKTIKRFVNAAKNTLGAADVYNYYSPRPDVVDIIDDCSRQSIETCRAPNCTYDKQCVASDARIKELERLSWNLAEMRQRESGQIDLMEEKSFDIRPNLLNIIKDLDPHQVKNLATLLQVVYPSKFSGLVPMDVSIGVPSFNLLDKKVIKDLNFYYPI